MNRDFDLAVERDKALTELINMYESATEEERHVITPLMLTVGHVIEMVDKFNETFCNVQTLTKEILVHRYENINLIDYYISMASKALDKMKEMEVENGNDD